MQFKTYVKYAEMVDAIYFDGQNAEECRGFTGGTAILNFNKQICNYQHLVLNGKIILQNSFIIVEPNGRFKVVKVEDFIKKYKEVEDNDQQN